MKPFPTSLASATALVRRHLSGLLLGFGLFVLAYVGFQYGEMYWQQRQLQRQWEAQQRRDTSGQPDARQEAISDDGLTRLVIPKIDLAAVVVEGTNHKALLLGPGHLSDTPAPGEPGNSVISAHRDTFFRHIYELGKGDEVVVQRSGRTYRYAVASKKIVQPNDMSVVANSKDKRLTLITCYPTYYIGPAPERLVVVGKLIEDEPAPKDGGAVHKVSMSPGAAQ